MRSAFSDALVRFGTSDSRVLLLTGDHGYALFDDFRQYCPDQFINAGIAEQNMVGMAAGLARVGYRPFVYGLSAFVPIRVVEQIKLDVAHDNLPVVFIGDGAGFVYSHLGTSHQSAEDIACLRAVPQIEILSPADRFEMAACMQHAYEAQRSVYLRMGKADRGDVHEAPLSAADVRRLIQVRAGREGSVALIATGSMVVTAVAISETIDGASVWSVPSIKPLDEAAVHAVAAASSTVIVIEEHSTYGGLGSAISEVVSERATCRVLRIGVPDQFSHKCGSYDYLLQEHGLDIPGITRRIRDFHAA